MEQIKETLYSVNKNGRAIQWSCFVEGSSYFMQYGQVGGKIQTKETKCKAKNIGKANETTPEEQALAEAQARWTKQWNREGYRLTAEEGAIAKQDFCMLAADGRKNPHYAKYPANCQRKLDGVRAYNHLKGDDLVSYSRELVEYPVHEELKEELEELMKVTGYKKLDGEFYIHGMPLQDIQSAVKNTKNENHNKVTFVIFDVPDKGVPWASRHVDVAYLKSLVKDQFKFITVIDTDVVNDEFELEEKIKEYEDEGYEGAMVRNYDGLYEFGFRSNDLIKFKNMHESEAKVIGREKDEKSDEGKLVCLWNDVEFELKMLGTHESRLYENLEQYIGKWITFIYQDLTKDGKPTFARGKCVRECDENGKPLV